MKTIYYKSWQSPVCKLHLYADDNNLLAVTFNENREAVVKKLGLQHCEKSLSPVIEKTIKQLIEYFSGERKKFNLPIQMQGTEFQKKAWTELLNIPFGKTISYAEQASNISSPKAVRAIGSANGKNPLSIIVPCHRVITSQSTISGYAGGSLIKEKLLSLEVL